MTKGYLLAVGTLLFTANVLLGGGLQAQTLASARPVPQSPAGGAGQKGDLTLENALGQLEKRYGIYFLYDDQKIKDKRVKLSLQEHDKVEQVLSRLLKPIEFTFKKVGDIYTIVPNEDGAVIGELKQKTGSLQEQPAIMPLQHEALARLAGTSRLTATEVADVDVSGTVTDEKGAGIPGVSVLVKGTTNGTSTDAQGTYKLTAPDNGTLVFSFIGYLAQEVPVSGRSQINVTLTSDVKALEEVVVVGYGTQKKETVTGSVATVKGADLVKSPAVNLSNSIAGRMPGVVALQPGGEPGYDNSSIRIRGSNTLGSNEALIVIDGIPARAGGFERLNPADIENISVLKDASAAIYGARAANGVILITTKRGKTGKPQLSYSFNQGWAQPTVVPKLANSVEYAEMRNELEIYNLPVTQWAAATEAFRTAGTYSYVDAEGKTQTRNAPFKPDDFQKFRDGSDPWGHPNTDWYKATLKTWSPQSRHNLQLTGGTENFKYLASLGYQNQDAFYKNAATGYKQYDLRVNLDANINQYIKTTIGLLGRQELRFYPTVPAQAIFRMQMRGRPNEPAFWPNGLPGPDIENGQNPVVVTTNQTGYDRDTRNYFQTNGSVEVTNPWIKGLKFTGTAAVDKLIRRGKRWNIPWFLYNWDKTSYEADGVTPKLVKGQRGPSEPNLTQYDEDQLNILLGGLLTYDRSFGNHAFTLLAGTNRETVQFDRFEAYRRFFISTAVDQFPAGGNAEKNNNGNAWERARLNYFGRVAYNYKEKYLAEFLWRYDGSYMFPENTRYGFFPGIMAGWQISEESFWKNNIGFVNYLKLRGSWGQMGNDQIYYDANSSGLIDGNEPLQEYQFLSTNLFRSYIIGNQEVLTLYEKSVENPTITWEVANNSNIGLEGQLFQGRINFEFDFFYNKRTNILWPRYGSVPQSTGMTLPPQNIGKVANRGFDALVGYNGQYGDFKYNISVNGGYAKNRILFWDEAPGAPEWQQSTGRTMYTGSPAYVYDGVFKDQSEIDANPIDYSAVTKTLRPGDMKYKDLHGENGDPNPDGKITPADRVKRDKNFVPRFQGGMNLGAQYRNFDLSVLFQGAAGAEVYLSTGESGGIGNFVKEVYDNRWTVDNPSSEHPRITDRSNQYYSSNNTYWLKSTDYIRLKNIELGYTLPSLLGQKAGINSVRIYVNALNLFTITKSTVFDPEATNTLGQYYPQSRILNTGLTVTF